MMSHKTEKEIKIDDETIIKIDGYGNRVIIMRPSKEEHRLSKRGPKKARTVAKEAADAIRDKKYSCIFDAAHFYFKKYENARPSKRNMKAENIEEARKERLKDFIKYIAEDLRNGPKTMHTFRALSPHTKKQLEQPIIKSRQHAKNIEEIRKILGWSTLYQLRRELVLSVGFDEEK